jgi:hypothetical protein
MDVSSANPLTFISCSHIIEHDLACKAGFPWFGGIHKVENKGRGIISSRNDNTLDACDIFPTRHLSSCFGSHFLVGA